VEEQQHGAELRQHGERLAGCQDVGRRSADESRVPEGDADEQLAEYGRLGQAFEDLPCELGSDHDEREGRENDGNGTTFGSDYRRRKKCHQTASHRRTQEGKRRLASRAGRLRSVFSGMRVGRAASWASPRETDVRARERRTGRRLAGASLILAHSGRPAGHLYWRTSRWGQSRVSQNSIERENAVDFIKVIRSIEELLYEVMSWLVFYPRTMWRILAHPAATTVYSDAEQGDDPAEQYTETLSPPLLLMLTILIAHGFELGMGTKLPQVKTALGKALLGTEQNLLMLRALMFSVFPLAAATTLVRRRQLDLDRKALRAPFFSQCYLTAPFALAISVAGIVMRAELAAARLAAEALFVLGCAWYLGAETGWFRRQLDVSTGRAFLVALEALSQASLYAALVAAVLMLLLR
jgi:hypothetical protein